MYASKCNAPYVMFDQNAVEALWKCVSDLLAPSVVTEDRHLAFKFLTSLISGQVRT